MAICKGVFMKPINKMRANSKMEEEEEPLSPMARLLHAPRTNCFIIVIFGTKTRTDVEVMKHGLTDTLLKHPRFSSKLVVDAKRTTEPVGWVRTKVSIDDHFIVPDLNTNMDSPEQFVEDYISNISKMPMDMSKPLWELYVVNVKTSYATSTIVLRVHHSLGDGISLMSLLLACTRKSSNPEALPSLPTNTNRKKPQTRSYSRFFRYFFAFLLIFKVLWNTLVDIMFFIATIICLKDTENPLKGAIGVERVHKRFVHKTLYLDDIKNVKNAMNMTVNDVVLGIVQAGLSRYLNRKYGEDKLDDKDLTSNLPKHIRLRAAVFMNLRPNRTIEGLAEMMKVNSKGGWEWGNLSGAVLFPLNISLKDDPLDYLRIAKVAIDKKKQSFEVWLTYFATKSLLNTLGVKAAATLFYTALSNTTVTFSNMVGPMEELSFYGHPVTFLAHGVYGFPQALTIHFQSYIDKMTMVLAVDESIISDPHVLCDDIVESLNLAKNFLIKRNLLV